MKFKIGDKVKILDYKCYITDKTSSIPSELMIHGNCMPRINHNATVVDAYGKYYIVNFINQVDEIMQLGYTEDNLELVSDEFVLPEKWCIKQSAGEESCEWFNKKYDINSYVGGAYEYLVNRTYDSPFLENIPDGYTEITFDQFKKYVLKDTVETFEKPKFEVGKWYKFIWKWDGSKWYYGQFDAYGKSSLMWSIWFRTDGSNLQKNAAFIDKELGEYSELTDLSEIQQYLPDGHPDKTKPIEKNEFKKGDYIVTLKVIDDSTLFNCGRNNYCFKQRVDSDGIFPEVDLQGSRQNGHVMMSFHKNGYLKDWRYATPEEIAEYDRLGEPYDVTTLKNETLVFDKYPIGTIVVSLENVSDCRKVGDLFKVLPNSSKVSLYYTPSITSASPSEWRAATESEIEAFNNGITNINNMNKSLVGRYLKALVDSPQSTSFKKGEYAKILDFYYVDKRPNKYKIEGDWCYTTNDLNKFELMPEGFVPPTKSKAVSEEKPEKWEPKVGDWVMISEEELPITSTWLGEGGRIKHQGPFLVEKIKNACVREMSGISVLLSFGRFRKAEPHEIPKTEEPEVFGQVLLKATDPNEHLHMDKPHKYTAEEALYELKRRGFTKGARYVYMTQDGTYSESDICTATKEPAIKADGAFIDCGSGYLWSRNNPTNLHEGPISEPTTNLCGEIVIPNIPKYDWVAPPTFQSGTSYQAKHNNTPNYSKPETLLTKTTLNY